MKNNMTTVQARISESLKMNAIDVLDKLGLNLSTYINMSLNQLIIQKKIPFEAKLNNTTYTAEEAIDEVKATMELEGMPLSEDEIEILTSYRKGDLSGDEIRKKILNEV